MRMETARRAASVPLLALLWGMNWPAVRIALAEIPPWTLRTLGLGAGALLLFAIAGARGRPLRVDRSQWLRLLVSSLLAVAGFNLLVTFAQIHGTTSRAAIVTYTMPIWTIVLAWAALGERPTRGRWLALALGVSGLALLAAPLAASGRFSRGILFALGASVLWAAGTVFLKRYPLRGSPLANAAWQLLVGAFVAGLGMSIVEGARLPGPLRPGVALALGYHIVFAIAIGYLLWFEVVARLPAGVAALGTLMVPAVGVLGAMAILRESPTLADWAGFALITAAATVALFSTGVRSTV